MILYRNHLIVLRKFYGHTDQEYHELERMLLNPKYKHLQQAITNRMRDMADNPIRQYQLKIKL